MIRHIVEIAREDLRDLARQRGTWVSLLMFPIINVVLIVVVPGLLSEREQAKQHTADYRVGVEASATDDSLLRSDLESAQFTVVPVDDARRAVRSREVHVGLRLEPGARAAFEGDGQAQARVTALTTRRASNLAFGRLIEVLEQARIERAEQRAIATSLPVGAVRPLEVVPVDLADSAFGAQLELAQTLPFLVLFPLTASLGIAAQRISGSKDLRTIEPLLLLPVPRFEILAGKALSALALGSVILPAVSIPLVIARFVPAGGAGRTVELAASTIVAVTTVAGLVLVLLITVGAVIGALARTSTEVSSVLPFATLPIILLALGLQFLTWQATPATALAPLVGPVLLVRDVGAGRASTGAALAAIVATVAWIILLLAVAVRFLERERSVLRVTD